MFSNIENSGRYVCFKETKIRKKNLFSDSQEQATLKAKQRMLKEDWELFKAQRKLIQQSWNKTAK